MAKNVLLKIPIRQNMLPVTVKECMDRMKTSGKKWLRKKKKQKYQDRRKELR